MIPAVILFKDRLISCLCGDSYSWFWFIHNRWIMWWIKNHMQEEKEPHITGPVLLFYSPIFKQIFHSMMGSSLF